MKQKKSSTNLILFLLALSLHLQVYTTDQELCFNDQQQIIQSLASISNPVIAQEALTIMRDCDFAVQQITQFSLPFTTSGAGLYCLGANVSVRAGQTAITINTDNVIIDLNGFTLQGPNSTATGILNLGRSGVIIMNGTITSMGTNGIFVSPNNGLIPRLNFFSNLILRNNGIGLRLNGVSTFLIDSCVATNVGGAASNNTFGFFIQQTFNGFIKSSWALNNGRGFFLTGNVSLTLEDCLANNNQIEGFNHNGGLYTKFLSCEANQNLTGFSVTNASANNPSIDVSLIQSNATGNTGNGFAISGSQQTVQECQANDNVNGFVINGDHHIILNNRASGNTGTGFLLATAVAALPIASNCQVRNNTAVGNSVGFSNASATNRIYANFANNNLLNNILRNFVGITNVAVSPTELTPINFTANISE